MPKVFIDTDERYPDYIIVSRRIPGAVEVDLTHAEVTLVERARQLYNDMQDLLARKIKEVR